jgi:hypothetical protein
MAPQWPGKGLSAGAWDLAWSNTKSLFACGLSAGTRGNLFVTGGARDSDGCEPSIHCAVAARRSFIMSVPRPWQPVSQSNPDPACPWSHATILTHCTLQGAVDLSKTVRWESFIKALRPSPSRSASAFPFPFLTLSFLHLFPGLQCFQSFLTQAIILFACPVSASQQLHFSLSVPTALPSLPKRATVYASHLRSRFSLILRLSKSTSIHHH